MLGWIASLMGPVVPRRLDRRHDRPIGSVASAAGRPHELSGDFHVQHPRPHAAWALVRVPIFGGSTAEVMHDGLAYSMPAEATCIAGSPVLCEDRVRIVPGRFATEQ
jgi:hypothetical protein